MTVLHLHGRPLPTTVIPMPDETVTFATVEYHGRRFRFAVRGASVPFEVSYLYEFGEPDQLPHAWFPIAPERAVRPEVLQEYLYPQLVELHAATMGGTVPAAAAS